GPQPREQPRRRFALAEEAHHHRQVGGGLKVGGARLGGRLNRRDAAGEIREGREVSGQRRRRQEDRRGPGPARASRRKERQRRLTVRQRLLPLVAPEVGRELYRVQAAEQLAARAAAHAALGALERSVEVAVGERALGRREIKGRRLHR